MEELKITLVQSDLHWESKKSNLDMFSRKLDAFRDASDLIILPEMFSTGFSMNPKALAETMSGSTVTWIKEYARKKNAVICGSFICEENGSYYNRLIWMRPDGSHEHYDKRHLFRMGEEDKHYMHGEKKLVVELKGWKICPLICYDLRFPVWARNRRVGERSSAEYDLLIYVANWPERRAHPWKTLLLARAIENQCYVAGVNRVGNDGNDVHYSGDSAVIDPKGMIISSIKENEEQIQTIALSFPDLDEFRKQFPAMRDADEFELK